MRKYLQMVLFLLPVLILFPHLNEFAFQPGSVFSDILVSHYPNGVLIQRAIEQWHTIPLWSDAILSGYPFAADPLSGLYYLPGWLALAFPLPLGFNLDIVLHLILGGVGMYCLLRSEDLSEGAAIFGALTFEALPKLYAHLAAGHLTLLYAVPWTPWLLYAERSVSHHRRLRWVMPGAVLGLIALADVRWAAYAGLLWLAYSLWHTLPCRVRMEGKGETMRTLSHWAAERAANSIFAGLVAAPLLLPLMEFTRLSTRAQLTAKDNLTFSLPPGQLLGLVYPNIGGMGEWVLYPGAVVLALGLFALCSRELRRRAGFWLGVIAVTLLVALGSYLAPLTWLARLPGFDLLRVPPRVLFITGLGYAAVAAYALQDLYATIMSDNRSAPGRRGLVLFAITALCVLFAVAVVLTVQRPMTRIQFAWGAVFLTIGVGLIFMARAKRLTIATLTILLLSTGLIDLLGVNRLSLDFRPSQAVFAQNQAVADFIQHKAGDQPFRVYSPSYSLPQHVAVRQGLELADGVDPLQLASYVRYMENATGIPDQGYSVTLPPYQNGDPEVDNQTARPDARLLGQLNIRYVVAQFPLLDKNLTDMGQFGQTHVYENRLALPRAWVQPVGAPVGESILSQPALKQYPNSIEIAVKGPGLLVLSELAYPGWHVRVDNQPGAVETVGTIFRGVRLDAGEHQVVFEFRPVPVYFGLAIGLLAWLILAVLALWRTPAHE